MDFEKKLENLFTEIHEKQRQRDVQISTLISELKPLISDIGDVTVIVPHIKSYLDLGVKNDEILVKLAGLVSKVANTKGEGDLILTDEERSQLLNAIDDLNEQENGG